MPKLGHYILRPTYNIINEFKSLPGVPSEKFHGEIKVDKSLLRKIPLKPNASRLTAIPNMKNSIVDCPEKNDEKFSKTITGVIRS